jgi:hypothetical protein
VTASAPELTAAASTENKVLPLLLLPMPKLPQWPGSIVEMSPLSRRFSTYVSACSWAQATTNATPVS